MMESPDEYGEFSFWRARVRDAPISTDQRPQPNSAVPLLHEQPFANSSNHEHESEMGSGPVDGILLSTAAGERLISLLGELSRHLAGSSDRFSRLAGILHEDLLHLRADSSEASGPRDGSILGSAGVLQSMGYMLRTLENESPYEFWHSPITSAVQVLVEEVRPRNGGALQPQ